MCRFGAPDAAAATSPARNLIRHAGHRSGFLKMGGRVGSVVARRAIDLKVRGSSPAHSSSRIAG